MNLNTVRVKEKRFNGAIDKKLFKHSKEYLVLAILKYLDPNRYEKVVLRDRPDLQGEELGIEVTIAESQNDMQADREFAQYCEGNNKKRRMETIQKDGRHVIVRYKHMDAMISGGGVNLEEKSIIQEAIKRKIASVKKYPDNHYKQMELAIIRTEIPSSLWMESVTDWVSEVVRDECEQIFSRIYVIGGNTCFTINNDGSNNTHKIEKEQFKRLSIIGRMTAEGELTIDDEEWN